MSVDEIWAERETTEGTELPCDLWSALQFYTESHGELPDTFKGEQGQWQPSFFFRGQDNLLVPMKSEAGAGEIHIRIRQEVQATFARWLKMQNVCVLMGAGASYYVTELLGVNLLEKIEELLVGRQSKRTLESILRYASERGRVEKDFEGFLSQLSALLRLGQKANFPLDKLPIDIPLEGIRGSRRQRGPDRRFRMLAELLRDIERAIAVLCNVHLPASSLSGEVTHTHNDVTPHEALMAKLVARDPHAGRARVFTTNYDTLIEQAMDRLGILYSDGFTGTVNRRFYPAVYDLDHYYPGDVSEGRVRRYDRVLHLYKLHGSINWRRKDSSTATDPFGIAFDASPIPTRKDILGSRNDNPQKLTLSDVFQNDQGLAILPTVAKYGETLTMPFAHLFRAFAQALQESQTVLFVIGYSGWDSHINQIIYDAIANPGFTCVVIDPKPSDWARRICHADACGRVYCLGGEWGTFEFFSRRVLPDLAILRTEMAVARTIRALSVRSADTADDEPDLSEVHDDDPM